MFNQVFIQIFIFFYFFNITTFLLFLHLLKNNIISYTMRKFFSIFFFFSLSGLPLSSLFFFKLQLFVGLFKQLGIIQIIIIIIIFVISTYLYYISIKKLVSANNFDNYSIFKNKKVLNNLEKIVYFNIITNISFIFLILFFYF